MFRRDNAVARGIEFLDQEWPGWHLEINTATLDLRLSRDCLLGQLFGHYRAGLRFLGMMHPARYGFALPRFLLFFSERRATWRVLTEEWRKVVEERRAKIENIA